MSLILFFHLFGLLLMLSEELSGCCADAVWNPPRPSISHVQAIGVKQSLTVRWLASNSGVLGESDMYQIQIGRTENLTIIYNTNVSVFPLDSGKYTWTWTSALPLECADHSVRIRRLYNQSKPSPWSDWVINYGARAGIKTKIFPFQRVLREGADALVCCVPPAGVHITSIAFNHSKYPLISIGGRVKAIAVKNLTIPAGIIKSLLFSCSDTTAQTSHFWNYISFPPQKPRNISCATADMATITCTWDQGRKRIPYDRNKQELKLYIENSDQVIINCRQPSCSFSAVPHLEEYNIAVVVRDQLGEERESHRFNISDRVFPVVELEVVIPDVTDATLSWIVHGNLTQLGLLCQVTADPNGVTMLNCQNVIGLCEVKLEHLHPNSRYSTRVRCAVKGRRWGDWTQPRTFITYPLVTLDIWRRIKQLSRSHIRQVTLLWTPHVAGSAATVNIQGYTIQWSQGGENRTEWRNSGQTQAEVSIGPGECDITVRAVLLMGPSDPAHITVSQMDDREHFPAERRLSGSLAAGFNLSWHEQGTAPCGHVVDWCTTGNKESCDLKWIKVPEGNMLILPAQHFQAGHRYTFSIYGCTEHGHRLLEIHTGYLQELKPLQLPSLVEPVHSTSSSVKLVWSYNEEDPTHLGFITGYLVTVQEASERSLGHTTNLFNVSVADPHRKSVTIDGLSENQEYTLCLSALTKEGPGPPARITIRTATNYSAYLAKILAPVLLLLGFAILLWSQRKTLKGIFAYPAGMNIKTLDLDGFHLETSEKLQLQTVEECVICDIEILNVRLPLTKMSTLTDPELQNAPPTSASPSSVSSRSPACVPLISHYCPQSSAELPQISDFQKPTSVINKSYFHTMEEDFFEPQQVTFSDITIVKASDCLQASCSVTEGYISNILHV